MKYQQVLDSGRTIQIHLINRGFCKFSVNEVNAVNPVNEKLRVT